MKRAPLWCEHSIKQLTFVARRNGCPVRERCLARVREHGTNLYKRARDRSVQTTSRGDDVNLYKEPQHRQGMLEQSASKGTEMMRLK